jgi:hypothetical protein
VLEKYDKTEFKFTFLGKTLDLDVTFADEEKVTDIQLISQISGTHMHVRAMKCDSIEILSPEYFVKDLKGIEHVRLFCSLLYRNQHTTCNTWS